MDTDTTTTDQSNREVVPPRLHLRPVRPMESGIGLPYAPENWPKPGDTWRWKVGPRITGKGTFLDRYLYPPKHLPGLSNTETLRKGTAFRSRLSLERYIRLAFPDADVRKFFASFSWAVPSTDGMKRSILPVYTSDEDPMHDNVSDIMVCKAGNDKCGSLMMPPPSETEPMTCDICCSEPSFCTDCSCILCCKSVSVEHEGYSYTKCEAVVSEGRICGHVAHINCALRAYMAGTVGGSIGLDAEYYCRRCDARKDLVPHVNRFLEICKTVEYQGDVEKILNLGICVLRGSQRVDAKELLNCIESTVIKLKCGTSLEDLWNDDTPTIWSDFSESEGKDNDDAVQSLQDVTPIEPMPFNREAEMHKLEEEIREVLKALREAQESEYQIAEVRLHAQKECLGDLYRQLEEEKSELSRRVSGSDAESLMTNVLKRLDQIRKEVTKLKEMEEVAKGFGRTPRGILEEYFHLAIEE
ncbi:protein OBERON 1-like isoform X2 [Brassica napus]|uniref:protein OBERON 1-like isoform X2 n=1 Tax=Brassica napus TaxID=3708 RepID=UPI000BBF0607|nr:protein OBERON 1-like isoform X2 [Brassica napus]